MQPKKKMILNKLKIITLNLEPIPIFAKIAQLIYVLVMFTFTIAPHGAKANSSNVPNVDLRVAAHKIVNNKPDQSIHFFKLYCGLGECSFEQLSLNECETVNFTNSFIPKSFAWTTWSGFLKVRPISKNELEVTVFQGAHRQLPATIKINYIPELPFSKRVNAFDIKGFIDLSLFPEIKTVEYDPITGPPHAEPINCPVMVPGIESAR